MNQIELHKKIDSLLLKNPIDVKEDEVSTLISTNKDARQYFFTKADERWLNWLWENNFLKIIKERADDPTRYGYRTPEINYLVKVSEKEPAKVVDIMLEVPISKENFNPGVINRFMGICSVLPAKELRRMVSKIHNDGWVPLMSAFNDCGFEYEKMFEILTDANDFESVLLLVETVLSVRSKKEAEQETRGFSSDNPFYFKELGYTKVFEYLLKVDGKNIERALALVTNVIKQVVLFSEGEGKDEVFGVYDSFFLLDIDFFNLELSEHDRLSYRDDIKNLAAVITELAKRTIRSHDVSLRRANELYTKYFKVLPDSRSMWRLKLFVLSLYPECFKDELKNAFFRLFGVERCYNELISGTEYLKALRAGFSFLSNTDKRDYIKRVIEYFVKKDQEKENEKEDWHIRYGSRILSVLSDYLNDDERQKATSAGFTIRPGYGPEPSIGRERGGMVVPQGPITQEEFDRLAIADIARRLRNEWSPEQLRKKYKDDDFLRPRNAEGAGKLLRVDISKRLQEYVNNANLFFERDILDQHYTYSFLRGIQETTRGNKTNITNVNWDSLIALCVTIKQSCEKKPFNNERHERDSFDAWLSGWTGVHSAITDVLEELLSEDRGSSRIDFSKHRHELFRIISYLLSHPDPEPKDEQIESAGMRTKLAGSKEYIVSDPYSMAINTVRGRAFRVFVLFIYQDGKKFPKREKVKISPDIKELYESVLENEKTRALMFMFGHYLPSFYFRDKIWVNGLLPQIFPSEPEKKELYLAAWEGYLANNLFEEMFFNPDIQKLYERGITLTLDEYTKRKYFKEPDEGIAIHLALAFMFYRKFGFDHTLFKAFWNNDDFERQGEFTSFIGRSFVSGENPKNKALLEDEPRSKTKLKEFWDWALRHCHDSKPLTMFGFWVNTEKDVFDIPWLAKHVRRTLRKTGGILEWEYGLIKSIQELARSAPADTLAILHLFLLEGGVRLKKLQIPFSVEREWLAAFTILYAEPTTKRGVYTLINDLIREGSSTFWGLKEVID